MFVKVADGIIINSDHITLIDLGETLAQVYLDRQPSPLSKDFIVIPLPAAHYLLSLVEASLAVDLETDPANYERSLTSQIAQALRDNFPYGATADQLAAIANADATAVYEALLSLVQEHVITCDDGKDGEPSLWFHVSNAPRAELQGAPVDFNSATCGYIHEAHGVGHPCVVSGVHTAHVLGRCDECLGAAVSDQLTSSPDPLHVDEQPGLRPGPGNETT